jgi:uncharacterized protein involved in type VI secretion and phage assembly
LAFISRLLEEEGIGYHFENGTGVCLLVLSDKDQGRAQLDPFSPLGAEISGRAVSSMKLGKRLRPRKVSLVDYNWKKPALDMSVEHAGSLKQPPYMLSVSEAVFFVADASFEVVRSGVAGQAAYAGAVRASGRVCRSGWRRRENVRERGRIRAVAHTRRERAESE